MLRRSAILLALALTARLPGTVAAQIDPPKVVAKSFDQDSVLAALTAECEPAKLLLVKSDKHAALFTRDEGTVLVSGRQVPLKREVTFHFEKARTGTRLVATEELVLVTGGGEERQPPDIYHLATDLQDVLNRVKARIGPGAAAVTDSTAAPR
jgi:hypothetical protein